MLRNLNVSSGGKRICGITRVGILASEIPTGFALPSFLAGLVDGSDPVGTQYRTRLLTRPGAPASLSVDEWGRAVFDGPDGVYTGTMRDYKTGVQQTPDSTYSITVGAAAAVEADLVIAYNVRSQVSADLVLSYNVAAASGVAVTADLILAYNVRAQIAADLSIAYNVRQTVTKDLVLSYNILSTGGAMSFTPSVARTITINAGSKPFTAGELWNMSDPKKPRTSKDPDATTDYSFDWTPWLGDVNDTISTHTILPLDGLVNEGSSMVGQVVTVFLSAGTPSKRAELTCRIATNSTPPRIEDRTIFLDIESR